MDPASILGLLTSVGAITGCIVRTLKDLSDLRAKYGAADLTVRLLKSELISIRSALDQIDHWAKYNLEDDQMQAPNFGEGLEATLDGCKIAMEVLAEDVSNLLGLDELEYVQVPARLGFRDKTKLIWHESVVKDHQERLGRQTSALHLLLTAIQCNTMSEQTKLLRTPENRQKIQNVVDDASTIRATKSQRNSTLAPSVTSGDTSALSSRPWDAELLKTDAYKSATLHQRSNSDSRREQILRRPDLNIQIQDRLQVDEGYETMSRTTSDSVPSTRHLSPTWSRSSLPRPLRPHDTNPPRASDPGNVYTVRNPPDPVARFNNLPRQPYSPVQSPTAKTLERKKSFWQSIRRKSDSAIEERAKQQDSATPGSRRGRKGFENSHTSSVDLSNRGAKNCPPIVRAAQIGSIEEIELLLEADADIEECHRPTGRNAMAVAAHCGNGEVVEFLLRQGATIIRKDYQHNTPLHLAASRGHIGVLRLLISENTVSLEEKGHGEKTPLRLSCDNGHLEATELLLAHGARVNARDKTNLTSLHAAAHRGDLGTVALLVKYGAQIQAKDANFMDALHYACHGGHNPVVELLLGKKLDIETPGNEGMTPLMTAASAGHAHTVELLLKRKASLKSKGSGDMTALHWAAFNGHAEVVDILAQKKAQINAVNVDGRTPLHLAVMAEHFSVVELLLRRNSLVEAQCRETFRPLHYACGFDNTDIALLLIRSKADVEASTVSQNRPLHIAVSSGKISNVRMLLEQGASIDARNANGDRPLLLASANGHAEIAKILLDQGASLRSKFAAGPSHEDSPLCVAAKNGHSDIVDLLISRGASVREKDEHAWPPLRYGAHYGHPEVVERLLAAGASILGTQTWGFNLAADNIGFAQNVNIPEDRKEHVMILLRNAEERERLQHESEGYSDDDLIRPRVSVKKTTVPELDHPEQSETRSPSTRAGSGGLLRRFSFECPSQPRSSDSEQPVPDAIVSPAPAGREITPHGLHGPIEPPVLSPFPRSQPPTSSPLRSTNMEPRSNTPARTTSEHVPTSRLKDINKRWQATVADVPTRSATVASNVQNTRRFDPSASTASLLSRLGPSSSRRAARSPVPSNPSMSHTDLNNSANNTNHDVPYYTRVPFSPDSITQPRTRPPLQDTFRNPPPPTRPPPPPPPSALNRVSGGIYEVEAIHTNRYELE